MATPLTITIEGTGVITDAESTTGWGVVGSGGITPADETDIFLQGSQAVSCKASGNKNAWLYYDIGAGTELDVSPGGTEEGEYLYIWFNVTTLGALDTLANDAVRVQVGSTTANFSYWTLGGFNSPNNEFGNGYVGGWQCICLDLTKPPTGVGGTGLDITSARYFGVYIKTLLTVKAENLLIDTIAAGKGLRIIDEDVTGWQEVSDYCNDFSTRAWGMFQERAGIYYVLGTLFVGDSGQTAVTTLSDEGRILRFDDFTYYDGSAWVTSMRDGFNGLVVEDAASFITTFTDGIIVGTDRGRSGSTFIGSELVKTTFDLYGGSAATSITKLYGSTFDGITGGITWGDDADHHCYSVTFTGCGQFDPVGAVIIRNCIFSSTTEFPSRVDSAVAYDAIVYTFEIDEANDSTTDDMTLLPASPQIGDAYYFGSRSKFNTIAINISTPGAGNTIVWEYWNGSIWTALSGVSDGTVNYSVGGIGKITFTVPGAWAKTTVSTWVADPLYYVRGRCTTAAATALGQQAWLDGTPAGGAVRGNANLDMEDCSFIANTDETGDNEAGGLYFDADADINLTTVLFSGNDLDVINDATATRTAFNYTADTWRSLFTPNDAVGQEFPGDGNVLSRAVFYMNISGSPTGDMVAKLYLSDLGSPAVPTGAALAVSNTIPASTVGAGAEVRFEFEDEYTLVNTTQYFIVLEYTSGTAPHHVQALIKNVTNPYAGGNMADYTGTWTGQALSDMWFQVHTDGIVKINNLEGSDSITSIEIPIGTAGTPEYFGATILVTAVDLTITVTNQEGDVLEGINVRYEESDGTEIAQGATSASGIFTFTANAADLPLTDALIIVRNKAFEDYATTLDIPTSGFDIPVSLQPDLDVDLP